MPDRNRADLLLLSFCTILFFAVVSDLATRGMTLDGTLYAGIARDLAAGIGSFWYPPTFVADAVFHEHPPLGVYLLSLMFTLVGDHFWTENLFSAVVLLLTVMGFALVFRLVGQLAGREFPAWYGLLMLFISPLAAWAYTNNYLENLLTLFGLLSVVSCLWALQNPNRALIAVGVSGLLIVAGLLVKGPVALWPFAFFPVYCFVFRQDIRKLVVLTLLQLGVVALSFLVIWLFTDGGDAIQRYFEVQLQGTFSGARSAQYGRSEVLLVLGKNLAGPLLYSGVLLAILRSKPELSRWAILFLLLALAASLPLMLSPRQYEHYLLPSLPLYAVSVGFVMTNVISRFCKWLAQYTLGLVVANILLLGFTAFTYADKFGSVSDDKDHLEFVELSRDFLAESQRLSLCKGFHQDRIRAYLYRYLEVKSVSSGASYELCLAPITSDERNVVVAHSNFRLIRVESL